MPPKYYSSLLQFLADIANGSQHPFPGSLRLRLNIALEATRVHQLVLEQEPKRFAISLLSGWRKGNRSSESCDLPSVMQELRDQTLLTLASLLSCGILADLSTEWRSVPQWRFPLQTAAARGKEIDLRSEESQKARPLTQLLLRISPGAECSLVGGAIGGEPTSQTTCPSTEISTGFWCPTLHVIKPGNVLY